MPVSAPVGAPSNQQAPKLSAAMNDAVQDRIAERRGEEAIGIILIDAGFAVNDRATKILDFHDGANQDRDETIDAGVAMAEDIGRIGAGLGMEVISGSGAIDRLGGAAAQHAGRGAAVLLIADPFLAQAGLDEPARRSLGDAGLAVFRFTEIRSDPTAEQIDRAADEIRRTGARLVVGLGGGSALDVAKLAAAVAAADAPAEAYALMARPLPAGALPVVALPTTAGTGSEATRTAVYTLSSGVKAWAWGDELRPKAAILDPALTVGLPPSLTAATGVDALVHAIEAATNNRQDPIAEARALEAIRLVAAHLPDAVAR
ncbi:MAG TPA: iron-containing alcohol dehydrogenase, partial [Alphaproteobacteria bacterium]|nr:iron-containing alcohol dehydrogenase [Alphaproteobacteria bacterium]